MPLQNRVCPDGEIIAVAARGGMMGNRGGRIHLPDRTLGRRRWASKAWIACRLCFNGRQRQVMSPHSYTELFFLDEATALAAGHRPCFECRRADAVAFATLWAQQKIAGSGRRTADKWPAPAGATRAKASGMDDLLHIERLTSAGAKRCYDADPGGLPDGVFVVWKGGAHLVAFGRLLLWSPAGYISATPKQVAGRVAVLTPRTIVAVILGGYSPQLHDTALRFR